MASGRESGPPSGRFTDVRRVEETDSTNADVAALARAGAPEGVVVVADHQRAGRGRRGRSWIAPPGTGLLVSVLLRPALAPADAPLAGLAAGVAAVEACAEVAGVSPSLKWPNDVVVEPGATGGGTAKLAGLLAESLMTGDRLAAVVVGMGCNLRRPAMADLPAGAAYLEDMAGRAVDREELLAAWLMHLDRWRTTLDQPGGARVVLDAYRRRCTTLGQEVRVDLAGATVEGRAHDVTDEGHLLVTTDEGTHTVTAGDVIHLRSPC